VDLLVEALSARGEVRGFFFAQVKGTAQSVSGTRLPIGLSPDAFNRLVGYPAPTYLVVADVRMGQSYVVAAHRRRTRWLSSVGRELPLHSDATRIALYREVVGFWTGRRNPRRARFGNRAPTGPDYVEWRGELLAEAALVFVPELAVFRNASARGYRLLATTDDGLILQFVVQAYSSMRMSIEELQERPELRWPLPAGAVRRARASPNPVFLLLFDADREHGRYARLDVLPSPAPRARSVKVCLPREQSTDVEGIRRLVSETRASRAHPAGSSAA
jgi:hypothetical protein